MLFRSPSLTSAELRATKSASPPLRLCKGLDVGRHHSRQVLRQHLCRERRRFCRLGGRYLLGDEFPAYLDHDAVIDASEWNQLDLLSGSAGDRSCARSDADQRLRTSVSLLTMGAKDHTPSGLTTRNNFTLLQCITRYTMPCNAHCSATVPVRCSLLRR